jgi:hypothetical protein
MCKVMQGGSGEPVEELPADMGHVLSSVLALHVWKVLPKTLFGFHVPWLRAGGRLFWALVMFFAGIAIAGYLTTKPKPRERATWAQSIFGAILVWVLLILGYGTIPHEWLQFAGSYLNFGTDTFFLHKSQLGGVIPFDINRQTIAHVVATGIYGFVLTTNVALFARWQKRPEPAPLEEGADAAPTQGWLRRRARRTSAFGRPVTVNE